MTIHTHVSRLTSLRHYRRRAWQGTIAGMSTSPASLRSVPSLRLARPSRQRRRAHGRARRGRKRSGGTRRARRARLRREPPLRLADDRPPPGVPVRGAACAHARACSPRWALRPQGRPSQTSGTFALTVRSVASGRRRASVVAGAPVVAPRGLPVDQGLHALSLARLDPRSTCRGGEDARARR